MVNTGIGVSSTFVGMVSSGLQVAHILSVRIITPIFSSTSGPRACRECIRNSSADPCWPLVIVSGKRAAMSFRLSSFRFSWRSTNVCRVPLSSPIIRRQAVVAGDEFETCCFSDIAANTVLAAITWRAALMKQSLWPLPFFSPQLA